MNQINAILNEVRKAVKGKDDCIEKTLSAIIAGGHILLTDVPGVGKTTLALAFSQAMALRNQRVQFTSDVMPSDIIGFSMYNKATGDFEYREGPIMCNLFLADEINRTSSKTQSALLEVMEEGFVTIDGVSHSVPKPFIVIATQNPKGSAGTQLLPESQLDRFMICISMGYPDELSEIQIADGKSRSNAIEDVQTIVQDYDLCQLQLDAEQVFIEESILKYVVRLMNATRDNQFIELGVSPRGTIACVKMAKAYALIKGRTFVLPDDIKDIFADVTRHRIVLNTKARVAHLTEDTILEEILKTVDAPTVFRY